MPTILITPEPMRHRAGPYVDLLRNEGFEIAYPKDPFFTRGLCSEEETIDELRGAVGVIAGGEVVTANVLSHLPELRVIARMGVGYDRIDIDGATAHNVVVTITPNGNHEAVAEHTLAFLFAVAKFVTFNDRETRTGTWPRQYSRPLRGQTLGILGLGRIGRSTAVRARALGMRVIATEPQPDDRFVREHGIELVDFDTLLAHSDYLSLHCPLNQKTRGIINKDSLAKMKPGSVLINTSRGGLVVEADLLPVLKDGPLVAAGLDVFEKEPVATDNPLLKLDNVVVSPHIGGVDTRSIDDMGTEAAQCILALRKGDWPDGAVVNPEVRATWSW